MPQIIESGCELNPDSSACDFFLDHRASSNSPAISSKLWKSRLSVHTEAGALTVASALLSLPLLQRLPDGLLSYVVHLAMERESQPAWPLVSSPPTCSDSSNTSLSPITGQPTLFVGFKMPILVLSIKKESRPSRIPPTPPESLASPGKWEP